MREIKFRAWDIYFWGIDRKLFDEADDIQVIGNIHEKGETK